MTGHRFERRRFLSAAGAAGAFVACGGSPLAAAAGRRAAIGIQMYSLRGYEAAEALRHAKELGFTHVEAYSGMFPVTEDAAAIAKQRAMAADLGLTISAHGVNNFTKDADANRRIFTYAKAVGIPILGADPDPDSFASLDELVREFDIRIAIHNHGPTHRYNKVIDVLRAIEGRDERIGACADLGHYIRSGERPVEVIRALKGRLYGIHLKDFAEMQDKTRGVILGQGHVDVPAVFTALSIVGFPADGALSIEYEENKENPLADIRECLRVAREAAEGRATAAPEPQLELGEPVTVALAPPDVRGWGPYQFPGLERLPDGTIQLSFHVEADSATAYGKPAARAVSADDGRTWKLLPREDAGDGTAASWQSPPLRLPNGDVIWAVQQRPLEAAGLKLPAEPVGRFFNYQDFSYYRLEDLPAECADGWYLMRLPAGGAAPRKEKATVRLPGQLRGVTEGVMPRPWLQTLFLAPDRSIWAVQYDTRIVDGGFKKLWWAMILRSTDGGRSFDLWSEIPYTPDTGADPKAAARGGFTEPTVCFMGDGAAVCLLRTTDDKGPGPMYIARSTDHGKTWSRPVVFDDLGVWPQMLRLNNGVTLAAYGRPGLYVRGTVDPAGLSWGERLTVVPPGKIGTDTCSYTALLPLGDDRALLAYSDFNLPDVEGRPCKGMRVREIRATNRNASPSSR